MNQSPTLFAVAHRASPPARAPLFRHSPRDAWLLSAALAQGVLTAAAVPLSRHGGRAGLLVAAAYLGVSILWCSNTVAHQHLHRPLFSSRLGNAAFSAFLSVLLGVPQSLWRARHLAHHKGDARTRWPRGSLLALEVGLIAALWSILALLAPGFLIFAYAPGYALGMALSALQGRYEHKAETGEPGSGVSTYGRLYNLLWFNDGYHVEHHRSPGEHWTRLPPQRLPGAAESPYPPVLRWIEDLRRVGNHLSASALGVLEKMVLGSSALQGFVIDRHVRAFQALLPALGDRPLRRVGIVGGGLFPRTVIALRRLLPDSQLLVVDASAENIGRARAYLAARSLARGVEFHHQRFAPGACLDVDLLVTPLALVGDRDALYRAVRDTPVLVHDWIWRRRGACSAVISLLLLKRLNLVHRRPNP